MFISNAMQSCKNGKNKISVNKIFVNKLCKIKYKNSLYTCFPFDLFKHSNLYSYMQLK